VTPGHPALTALVLSGGAASRMGGSKAERRLGPTSLIERSLAVADAVAGEVLLLPGARPVPACAAGRRVVPDWPAELGAGPLAALGAGLEAARHPWCLLLPCDMPWLSPEIVHRLADRAPGSGHEIVALRGQAGWEPFPALYRTSLAGRIRDELARGRRSLAGLIDGSRTLAVAPDELADLDPDLRSLANVNTPAELLAAELEECRR